MSLTRLILSPGGFYPDIEALKQATKLIGAHDARTMALSMLLAVDGQIQMTCRSGEHPEEDEEAEDREHKRTESEELEAALGTRLDKPVFLVPVTRLGLHSLLTRRSFPDATTGEPCYAVTSPLDSQTKFRFEVVSMEATVSLEGLGGKGQEPLPPIGLTTEILIQLESQPNVGEQKNGDEIMEKAKGPDIRELIQNALNTICPDATLPHRCQGVLLCGGIGAAPSSTLDRFLQEVHSGMQEGVRGEVDLRVERLWFPSLFLHDGTSVDSAYRIRTLFQTASCSTLGTTILILEDISGLSGNLSRTAQLVVDELAHALGEGESKLSSSVFVVATCAQGGAVHSAVRRHLYFLETPLADVIGGAGQNKTSDSSVFVPPPQVLVDVDHHLKQFRDLFVFPLQHIDQLREWGLVCPKGALVLGPTGTGKTALLKAMSLMVETDCLGVNVTVVDAHSLVVKEVGGSEKNVQAMFQQARRTAPSVLVIDHLDAIAAPRGKNIGESDISKDRVLSTLLIEMDGVGTTSAKPVLILASADNLATLDPAVCRSGRLDFHVQLFNPSPASLQECCRRLLEPARKVVAQESAAALVSSSQKEAFMVSVATLEADLAALESKAKTHWTFADVKSRVQESVSLLTL